MLAKHAATKGVDRLSGRRPVEYPAGSNRLLHLLVPLIRSPQSIFYTSRTASRSIRR